MVKSYVRLPVYHGQVPGALLEGIFAHVRGGENLGTYDYVDVIDRDNRLGWSIKATKESTPVTWKRAKLPNKEGMIEDSNKSARGKQALGNAIIDFCNSHIIDSYNEYELAKIGYSRLIVRPDNSIFYFEKLLSTYRSKNVFNRDDFEWKWSSGRIVRGRKEQLPALHGIHKKTGVKWWAWHGLGENQLHFTGEREWWPGPETAHALSFFLPSREARISWEVLANLLDGLK